MRSPRLAALLAVALLVPLLGAAPGGAAPNPVDDPPSDEMTYIRMSDGVDLAVRIRYPEGFSFDDVDRWPTIFRMDFYDGGAGGINPASYGDNYVTVHASVRGTGCSGGRFDLFDERGHGLDGYEIIEGWIAQQPWSNGRVAITGHSGPGLVGALVAATNPPSVKATAISGLIGDLYRGIVYPGGVSNMGFPLLWTVIFRPFYREHPDNLHRYTGETASGDTRCAEHIANRPPPNPLDDPILQGAASPEYDAWWASRSVIPRSHGIRAPIHISHQYQDEQTGPRGGPAIFEAIAEDVPKRLFMSNGHHGRSGQARASERDWIDCWVLHDGNPGAPPCRAVADPSERVVTLFERGTPGAVAHTSADFPLPETHWTRVYLRGDGTLSTEPPGDDEGSSDYVSVPAGRQSHQFFTYGNADDVLGQATASSGPDELDFRLEFAEDTAIAGPITATFHASSTALETDFFVQLIDVDPDGNYQYLQRGMLRASHRKVDELRSDRIANGPLAGEIYRPHRPHTNPTPLEPGEVHELLIEVFPLGHVFREGHSLLVKIHDTPASDSFYNYVPASANLGLGRPVATTPAVNTIHHDAEHPSHLLLPVLPDLPAIADEAPGCGEQTGLRCVTPASG